MKAGLSEIYGDDGPEDYNVEMKKAKPEKKQDEKVEENDEDDTSAGEID